MLKRTILAVAAFSMLALPAAQAQSRHDAPRPGKHHVQAKKPAVQAPRRHHVQKPVPHRQKFMSGQRMSNWQRHQRISDHRRYGLRAPARGQQWVKVDNQYLLISLATGIIAGIAYGR